ncbi:hypothetical protein HGM15179_017335 [Zosterops borbonicus]|uniref:Secreted protein n=1 Tax=Zosterops borbonicus TaxID=364589 RepID=A0A8K1G111_9PASS|nr:hypothetical protein HGM15179_017335 [Zosterops borbonicus]
MGVALVTMGMALVTMGMALVTMEMALVAVGMALDGAEEEEEEEEERRMKEEEEMRMKGSPSVAFVIPRGLGDKNSSLEWPWLCGSRVSADSGVSPTLPWLLSLVALGVGDNSLVALTVGGSSLLALSVGDSSLLALGTVPCW